MIREDVLQRMYDAGLEARYESMYDRVQYQRQRNRFNVAACEALIHQSGATNFDVSVPVPYSIFSHLPHVAPEFSPAIIQGAPIAYPLSLSTADTRETSRARQSKEGTRSRSNAASAQVNDATSYNSVPSNVMNAAYKAGVEGARFYRLQQTRDGLRRFHPKLDYSTFTPEGLFPNMSLADIDALDEDAFMAKINKWKSDNGLDTDAVEAQKERNRQTVETNRADREAFGGTIKFTLATGCTTKLSKPTCADNIKQHLSGVEYKLSKCTGKRVGQPCKTCVKFVGDLQEGTACKPCDQFWYPRNSAILKAAKEVQDKHGIDFGVTIVYKPYPKKRTAAPKPQGAKKAKTAAPAE